MSLLALGLSLLACVGILFLVLKQYQGRKAKKQAPQGKTFRPKLSIDVETSPILNPINKQSRRKTGNTCSSATFLVIDTESFDAIEVEDGEIKEPKYSPIIALSWQVLDQDKRLIKEASHIVRRSGTMTAKAKAIHLITERHLAQGEELQEVLKLFTKDLRSCPVLVAHNLNYHLQALCSAYAEYSLDDTELLGKTYLCTMMKGLEIGFKRRKNGERLYPSLGELFAYLYFARPSVKLTYTSKTLRDIRLVSACLRRL